jgi:hypothetical protein
MRCEPEQAARLYGAAAGLRDRLGTPASPAYRAEHERIRARVQAAMEGAAFAAAVAAGRELDRADAARMLAGVC